MKGRAGTLLAHSEPWQENGGGGGQEVALGEAKCQATGEHRDPAERPRASSPGGRGALCRNRTEQCFLGYS